MKKATTTASRSGDVPCATSKPNAGHGDRDDGADEQRRPGPSHQVIDLEVISLGEGQWHGIRDFRRDSPTDRPDAGNSNDGTRQDIRETSHGDSLQP